MFSFSKFDISAAIFCVLCILFFGSLYYKSNVSSYRKVKASYSVGTVTSIKNKVQYKEPQSFVWTDLAQSDALQQNDSIYIGPDSNATIRFGSGQAITLKENSMLSFTKNNSTFNIALQFGELESEKIDSLIEIDVCGKKEFINAKDAQKIQIRSLRNCKIEALAQGGQFEFSQKKMSSLKQVESSTLMSEDKFEIKTTSADNTQELYKQNTDLLIEAPSDKSFLQLPVAAADLKIQDPALQVKKPEFQFFQPKIDSSYTKKNFYSQQSSTSNFYLRWQNFNRQVLVFKSHIEISRNKNFSDLLLTDNTPGNVILLKSNLTKGRYFWRVRFKSISKYSDWSNVAEFTIF